MHLTAQLRLWWTSLGSPRRLTPPTALWLGLYLLLATAVLGGLAAWLVANQDTLKAELLRFFLPDEVVPAAGFLVDRYLGTQTRGVLLSLIVSGALVLISALLFPVKEKVSATFEAEGALTGRPAEEFPLWFQAAEEVKLFVFYMAMSLTIIRVGYSPDPARARLALGLSTLLVAVTFAIDFIAPTLQRHRLRYSQVIKTLARRPVLSLCFGASFGLPPVAAGAWLSSPSMAHWSLPEAIAVLFGVNLVCIAGAVLAGTVVGARLLDEAEATPVSIWPTRAVTWLVLLGAVGWHSLVFGQVGLAAYRVSPVLKLEYSLDIASVAFDTPGIFDQRLGISALVRIHNPTHRDAEVGDNRIELTHQGEVLATTALPQMSVAAGETAQQRLAFHIDAGGALLGRGLSLAGDLAHGDLGDAWGTLKQAGASATDPQAYAITLFLKTDLEEFPVYLLAPKPTPQR